MFEKLFKNKVNDKERIYEDRIKELKETIQGLKIAEGKLIEAETKSLKDKINFLEQEVERLRGAEKEIKNKYEEQMTQLREVLDKAAINSAEEMASKIIAETKATNLGLKQEIKMLKEQMDFYKSKFESGKVELGAAEIKGLLLSANPAGPKIFEMLKNEN